MSNPTIIHAARMMNARRLRKNGKAGMKEIAAKASATKLALYGPLWADRTRQGKKLTPTAPTAGK